MLYLWGVVSGIILTMVVIILATKNNDKDGTPRV